MIDYRRKANTRLFLMAMFCKSLKKNFWSHNIDYIKGSTYIVLLQEEHNDVTPPGPKKTTTDRHKKCV